MAMLSQPAFGPRTALTYITAGTLLDVWTVVWYFAFARGQPLSNTTSFWLAGLFLSGITLMVIGAFLGPIGQAARKAELPPVDAINAEAQIQQTAAAVPHAVVAPTAGPVASPAPLVMAPPNAAAPGPPVPVRR